jgi:hypothetical protein
MDGDTSRVQRSVPLPVNLGCALMLCPIEFEYRSLTCRMGDQEVCPTMVLGLAKDRAHRRLRDEPVSAAEAGGLNESTKKRRLYG